MNNFSTDPHLKFWNLLQGIATVREILGQSDRIMTMFNGEPDPASIAYNQNMHDNYNKMLRELPMHKAIIEPRVEAGEDAPYSHDWDSYYAQVLNELKLDFDPFEELYSLGE